LEVAIVVGAKNKAHGFLLRVEIDQDYPCPARCWRTNTAIWVRSSWTTPRCAFVSPPVRPGR
jgi:hypothetical protein